MSGVATEAISIVWNAVVAAATFVADLETAEMRFAFDTAALTASVLTEVGDAIVSAFVSGLQWVVNYVIKPLVTAAFGPISRGTTSWADHSNSTVQVAQATLQSGSSSITHAGAEAIWSSLDPVFTVTQIIAVAAVVAIGILTAFTLGTETIIANILLGLILSAIVYSILPPLVDQVTESLVYGVESCANGTASQAPYQLSWSSFADAVEWYDIGFTTSTATMALRTTITPWIDASAFAFALTGGILSGIAYAEQSRQLAIEALVFSGVSVVLDGIALGQSKIGPQRTLDYGTLVLDAAVFGVGLAKVF